MVFRIHGIHSQKRVGKQGALLSPNAAADLQNHIPAVVGIFGQQEDGQLFFQRLQFRFGFSQFLLRHFLHFRVMKQLLRLLTAAFRSPVGTVSLHHWGKLFEFSVDLVQLFRIAVNLRIAQPGLQILIAECQTL